MASTERYNFRAAEAKWQIWWLGGSETPASKSASVRVWSEIEDGSNRLTLEALRTCIAGDVTARFWRAKEHTATHNTFIKKFASIPTALGGPIDRKLLPFGIAVEPGLAGSFPRLHPTSLQRRRNGTRSAEDFLKSGNNFEFAFTLPSTFSCAPHNCLFDPMGILQSFGADAVRLYALSSSPISNPIKWTENGIRAAAKFIQRLWRLNNEVTHVFSGDDAKSVFRPDPLEDTSHKLLAFVERNMAQLRPHNAVAGVHSLANALDRCLSEIDDVDEFERRHGVLRRAAHRLVSSYQPILPHLAEECRARLGSSNDWQKSVTHSCASATDVVSIPLHVNGIRRGRIEVSCGVGSAPSAAQVLSSGTVKSILGKQLAKRVIVVPGRTVNVVV